MNPQSIGRSLCVLFLTLAAFASAEIPDTLHHQGRIAVNGVNFQGVGQFKFVLFHQEKPGTTITPVWKNDDPAPTDVLEPAISVGVGVAKGIYSVALGAAGQAVLPSSLVPPTGQSLYLRIWFDDGVNGSQQLMPDQIVDAVAFARHATEASTVPDGAITSAKLAPSVNIPNVQSGVYSVTALTLQPFTVPFASAFAAPPIVTGTPALTVPSSIDAVTSSQFEGLFSVPAGTGATIADDDGKAFETSMAVVDGRPAIAYVGFSNRLHFAINSAADGSGAWAITEVDTYSGVGYCSLAVVGGKPAIAYNQNVSSGNLKFAINDAADGSGVWTTSFVETGSATIGIDASLTEVDGRPAIAYLYASGVAYLKFAINASADGSGIWDTSVVDFSGSTNVGYDSSLKVIDGRPAVSYYDATNDDLKFAINAASDGSGLWTLIVVDSADDVGKNTALLIVDGRPAISYEKTTGNLLKFAINANADATGAWSAVEVPGASTSGENTSLQLINGAPAILYSASNSDLGISVNSSSDGTGVWTNFILDEAGFVGRHGSLAVVGGIPMASYADNGSNSSLKVWVNPSISFNWIAVGQ